MTHRWSAWTTSFLLVALVLIAGWRAAPALAAPSSTAPVLPATSGWPLAGSPRVTQRFDPPAERWGAGHRGVDLAGRPGEQVLAAANGRVAFAGSVAGKPVVTIDHGGGLSTTYEPVAARVSVGTEVQTGAVIGVLTTGSHCVGWCLHWGLRQDKAYLDPLILIKASSGGPLRLVAKARRAEVQREAAARAAAEAAAKAAASTVGIISGSAGPPGSHGFAPSVPGGITSPFGQRFHPVLKIWKLHDGTDFGAACGTPIRAPYAGRVTQAYANGGYGNRLFLDHGSVDGRLVVTAYNHATGYIVGPGDSVRRGQVIGYVGRTGYATGCHLHLMVWLNGQLVNPMSWF